MNVEYTFRTLATREQEGPCRDRLFRDTADDSSAVLTPPSGRRALRRGRAAASHVDADGLLTPRSSAFTLPFQAGGLSGGMGCKLAGHSGEKRVGLAPASRLCIAIGSVATITQQGTRTYWTMQETPRLAAALHPTVNLALWRETAHRAGSAMRRRRAGGRSGFASASARTRSQPFVATTSRCLTRGQLSQVRKLSRHDLIWRSGSAGRPGPIS